MVEPVGSTYVNEAFHERKAAGSAKPPRSDGFTGTRYIQRYELDFPVPHA
jgi:hypothetical protein